MIDDHPFQSVDVRKDLELGFVGPALSTGPLPALFYFALSAKDSLCLDPFNQPVAYLSSLPMRIFSLTLPGHGDDLPPTEALNFWAEEIAEGRNSVKEFVEKVKLSLETLMHKGVLLPDKIGVAGLSRGAFIATHTAAAISHFRWILGFAPVTQLSYAKEFQTIANNPLVQSLALENTIDRLTDRSLRFYIGNLDTRVGTRLCFDFIEKLAKAAFEKKIRSPNVELIIGPSIGHMGHGTSKEVFHSGAQWIAEQWGVGNVV